MGQYERAIQDYDEAIRLNPQLAVAYANRAFAYTSLGKDTEAEQDINLAIELGIDRAVMESTIQELKSQR